MTCLSIGQLITSAGLMLSAIRTSSLPKKTTLYVLWGLSYTSHSRGGFTLQVYKLLAYLMDR